MFGTFVTYTCNNPGTVNSYCSNSNVSQLKQTCVQNQTCSNGQCISTCQPSTYTFTNAWDIRTFVNNYYGTKIVQDTDPGSAALSFDSNTELKICQLKGYTSVVSATSDNYYSCFDNGIVYWNGNSFVTENACKDNNYIWQLVCGKSC